MDPSMQFNVLQNFCTALSLIAKNCFYSDLSGKNSGICMEKFQKNYGFFEINIYRENALYIDA